MRNKRNQKSQNDSSITRYGRGTETYSNQMNNRENYNDRSYDGNDRTRDNDQWGRSRYSDNNYDYQRTGNRNRFGVNDQENSWEDNDNYSGSDYGRYSGDGQRNRSYEGRSYEGRSFDGRGYQREDRDFENESYATGSTGGRDYEDENYYSGYTGESMFGAGNNRGQSFDGGRYDERKFDGRRNTGRHYSSQNNHRGSSGYSNREPEYSQERNFSRERNYPTSEGYDSGRSYTGEYWDRD